MATVEIRLERMGLQPDATSFLPEDYQARVAVVFIDWYTSIVPWRPEDLGAVEFMADPQELNEVIRYWWSGLLEDCDAIQGGTTIDLWIRPPCCDTIPGSPECIVSMRYADRAPDELTDSLTTALAGQ